MREPSRQRLDPTPPPIGLGLADTPVPPSLRGAAEQAPAGNGRGSNESSSLIQELVPLGFHPAVEEFKRRLLCQTIAACGGNRAEAARRLGLQRTYLYRLTKQLNVSVSHSSPASLPPGLPAPAEQSSQPTAATASATRAGRDRRGAEGQTLA